MQKRFRGKVTFKYRDIRMHTVLLNRIRTKGCFHIIFQKKNLPHQNPLISIRHDDSTRYSTRWFDPTHGMHRRYELVNKIFMDSRVGRPEYVDVLSLPRSQVLRFMDDWWLLLLFDDAWFDFSLRYLQRQGINLLVIAL